MSDAAAAGAGAGPLLVIVAVVDRAWPSSTRAARRSGRASSINLGDLHHPDGQPEPDQRLHRRLLARPDRVHGPRRLRLGDPDAAAPGEGVLPARTCRPGSPASTSTRSIGPVPGRVPGRDADRGGAGQRRRLAGRAGPDAAVGPLRRGRDARASWSSSGSCCSTPTPSPAARGRSRTSRRTRTCGGRRPGRCSSSTSCGGSSARRTGATCSPSARTASPRRRSASG